MNIVLLVNISSGNALCSSVVLFVNLIPRVYKGVQGGASPYNKT